MKLWLFCLLVLGLSGVLVAAKPQGRAAAPAVAVETGTLTEQVTRGQSIFALRCAVCHGETGGGLEEARLAFPEDHRRCESCHKPGNPDLQTQISSFEAMRGRTAFGNAFAIGVAPPLHGPDALAAFGDADALQTYIRAAMPRHAPGTLNDEQSYALTAFVLNLNRALPEGAVVDQENAAALKLP